mmetsp:Transcript_41114/g.63328  ORF Transcript_41114/g.63328 Transcript_41114/m.63328 type:complete len:164 (-) Transcript_41114:147-638(-)|eukprot:CAMPEP_0117026794 /NCGR_PEP_ID=MMETSP0472-20121206/19662_1 /TAXON_ID=693140 ORGANISM="Tiarina fusus, Strain LIS" /NCGR_SAMPLE_ID=MMETSP0472 /ASSEMBLY_ACC=CAM_ASM_000603 /LENGTH=163 /DNA_ID=CAMNT_0004733895 /DNA_START=160 /DNA_END=654 /DNA_ORIENTATION=+
MAPSVTSKSILKQSSSPSSANSLDRIRKVWFDSVEIKYYDIILGDNPAVSDGAPVTIDWKAHDEEVVDVDCYEVLRNSESSKRKDGSVSKISVQKRAALLLDYGYSIKDLAAMIEEIDEIKGMRAESATNKKWDRFNEVFESTGRTIRKLTGRKNTAIRNPAA